MLLLVVSLLCFSTGVDSAHSESRDVGADNNSSEERGCNNCVQVCCESDRCEQVVKQVESSLANSDLKGFLLTVVNHVQCTHGSRVNLNISADYTLDSRGRLVVSSSNRTFGAGQFCLHSADTVSYCREDDQAEGRPGNHSSTDSVSLTPPIPVYKCCPAGQVMEEVQSSAPTRLCVGSNCDTPRTVPVAPAHRCRPEKSHTASRWRPLLLYNYTITPIVHRLLHTAGAQLQCPRYWGQQLTAYMLHQRRRSRWFQLSAGQFVVPQIDMMFAPGMYCQDWLPSSTTSQPHVAQVCMKPATTISDRDVTRLCRTHCYRRCCPLNTTLAIQAGASLGDYCVPSHPGSDTSALQRPPDTLPVVVGLPQQLADPSAVRYVIQVSQSLEQMTQQQQRCPVGTACSLAALQLPSGDLYVPRLRVTYPIASCCLNTRYKSGDGGVTVAEMVTEAVCAEATANRLERLVTHVLYVSCVCLLMTLCGLASLCGQSTLHDHCLAAHSASLLAVYLMIALSRYVTSSSACLLVGALNYMANMAAYVWLNVINYNIWRSITKAAASTAPPVGVRRCGSACSSLLRYHCLGWGLPLVMTVVLVLTDVVWQQQQQVPTWPPPPDLAYTYCHHPYGSSAQLYYYTPMLVLTLPTAFFFGSTVTNLVRHYRSTAKLSAHTGLIGQTRIYLKLFLAMELCWVLEAIIVFADVSDGFSWVALINATCGMSTLLMFLAGHNNRKRLRQCAARAQRRWRLLQWRRTTGSQHTTTGTPFAMHSYKQRAEESSDMSSSASSSTSTDQQQQQTLPAGHRVPSTDR